MPLVVGACAHTQLQWFPKWLFPVTVPPAVFKLLSHTLPDAWSHQTKLSPVWCVDVTIVDIVVRANSRFSFLMCTLRIALLSCVCVCVSVCSYVCANTCFHVFVEARGGCQVSSSITLCLFLWGRISLWMGLLFFSQVGNQQSLAILLSLLSCCSYRNVWNTYLVRLDAELWLLIIKIGQQEFITSGSLFLVLILFSLCIIFWSQFFGILCFPHLCFC